VKDVTKQIQLSATSLRQCEFYIDYINRQKDMLDIKRPNNIENMGKTSYNPKYDTIEEYLSVITEEITKIANAKNSDEINKHKYKYNFINGMINEFNENQLSTSELIWLSEKNERLCNWAWCFINTYIDRKNTFIDYIDPNKLERYKAIDLIQHLSIEPIKKDHSNCQQRIEAIKLSFKNGTADKKEQQEIIKLIIKLWENVSKFEIINEWLDTSNPKQINWTWSYLNNEKNRRTFRSWTPIKNEDKAAAIIAAVDVGMFENQDRTELVLFNMKKAWSQKKFRDKNDGKKVCSMYMDVETKTKLNSLAKLKGLKLNETIEQLIQNEFEKLKPSF
jgi:hypothetical protein